MLNLDTHILIHALAGKLRARERELLADNEWGIASIVLWELAKLVKLGRLEMNLGDPQVKDALSSIHVWPLDLDVALISTRLDFLGDPADELIAATSLAHNVPLLTRDKAIRRSRMVPLAR